MKILSFGSLNYDYTYEVEHFLAPKETLAAKSMQRGFGGKGANQSIAFARAGLSVYHAGRVGADGQPFVDYLKQNGIHTDYLIKDDAAATGHAIIEVCRGENCILIYGGANQEITTEQIDHTLKTRRCSAFSAAMQTRSPSGSRGILTITLHPTSASLWM